MATLFRDVLLSRAIFLLSSHRNQYLLPFRFSIGSFQTRIAAVGPRSAMLTSQSSDMRQQKRRARTFNGNEGTDFVRCRICGDYRRVISARHLSKHEIERERYMEEYHLSPDKLIAKEFRMIQSSRTGYYPYGKSDWIAAITGLKGSSMELISTAHNPFDPISELLFLEIYNTFQFACRDQKARLMIQLDT
jgi:hypothetical protein